MKITENDLTLELRRLNEELNPSPETGEFTIIQYAAAQLPPLTRERAKTILENGVKDGKISKRKIYNKVYYKKV
jgi:hypothetical protein